MIFFLFLLFDITRSNSAQKSNTQVNHYSAQCGLVEWLNTDSNYVPTLLARWRQDHDQFWRGVGPLSLLLNNPHAVVTVNKIPFPAVTGSIKNELNFIVSFPLLLNPHLKPLDSQWLIWLFIQTLSHHSTCILLLKSVHRILMLHWKKLF